MPARRKILTLNFDKEFYVPEIQKEFTILVEMTYDVPAPWLFCFYEKVRCLVSRNYQIDFPMFMLSRLKSEASLHCLSFIHRFAKTKNRLSCTDDGMRERELALEFYDLGHEHEAPLEMIERGLPWWNFDEEPLSYKELSDLFVHNGYSVTDQSVRKYINKLNHELGIIEKRWSKLWACYSESLNHFKQEAKSHPSGHYIITECGYDLVVDFEEFVFSEECKSIWGTVRENILEGL